MESNETTASAVGSIRFIQTVDDTVHQALKRVARHRGVSVQQLIRAVIIPEWFQDNHEQLYPAKET